MEDNSGRLALADGAEHDLEEWQAAAAAVLRKAKRLGEGDPDSAAWAALTRRTLDGIEIAPLGTGDLTSGLGEPVRPPVRAQHGWDIRAWHADPDPERANRAVLEDLATGATSLLIQVGAAGVPAENLAVALRGVLLDAAPVVLQPDSVDTTLAGAEALAGLLAGVQPAAGSGLGADPVGFDVRRGTWPEPGSHAEAIARIAALAREHALGALVADGTAVHDRGASDVQEIGYAVAVAVDYLRALVEAGIGVGEAARLIEFRLAVTDEQFTGIAKLRAARRLWARVLELSGAELSERGMRLHAVTSRPMMSRYDPWVNMLRTTVAAFAAGVGGADAVTVLPFDAPLGLPDDFARRIARNTSSLLIEESQVGKVADPAGGAYAVERLSEDLAQAGWAEFVSIDDEGLAGLAGRIATVAEQRHRQIATRERPLTGLSEFPNSEESLPQRRPYPDGAIPVQPYGAAFEAMRDQPATQPVFLATMGSVAAHTARATFARNLFAAGGVDVVVAGATDDVAGVLAAYSGQPVVCLAGPDRAYQEWGADLVDRLREAGASRVIVAGSADGLAVDDDCALGVDALAFLERTRTALEEAR